MFVPANSITFNSLGLAQSALLASSSAPLSSPPPAGAPEDSRLRNSGFFQRIIPSRTPLVAETERVSAPSVLGLPRAQVPPAAEFRHEGVGFADNPTLSQEISARLFGDQSYVYNLGGLGVMAGGLLAHGVGFSRQFGVQEFLDQYRFTRAEKKKRFPVERSDNPAENYYARAVQLFRQFEYNYARFHGLNIHVIGGDLIPASGHAVYAALPHTGLYTDFMVSLLDSQIGIIACVDNFRNNPISSAIGLAHLLDHALFPMVTRRKLKDTGKPDTAFAAELKQHSITSSLEFGMRPLYYINGGRVEMTYDDEGNLEQPTIYAAVPSKNVDHVFIKPNGLIQNAMDLAEITGEPVQVPFIGLEGFNQVMGKAPDELPPLLAHLARRHKGIARLFNGNKFPFIMPNGARRDVTMRVDNVMTVQPAQAGDDREALAASYAAQVLERSVTATRSNKIIFDHVREWLRLNPVLLRSDQGMTAADSQVVLDNFRDLANTSAGLNYLIIAGRIRAIHPSNVLRREAMERLLSLAADRVPADDQRVIALLSSVTAALRG